MCNYEWLPDPNVEAVRSKLLDRSKKGLQKYGTDTTRSDLDAAAWLRHLQEELMDAAVYLERVLVEPSPPPRAASPCWCAVGFTWEDVDALREAALGWLGLTEGPKSELWPLADRIAALLPPR